MSDAEQLATTTYLAEAALECTLDTESKPPTEAEVRRDALEIMEQIRRQAELVNFERTYDPKPSANAVVSSAKELVRLKERRMREDAEVKDESTSNPVLLRTMLSDWTSETDRLKGQLLRAQEQIAQLLAEKEDQTSYLKTALNNQWDRFHREKQHQMIRSCRLPCAFVRVTVAPKMIKSKGILINCRPPDAEAIAKVKEAISNILCLHKTQPTDIEMVSEDAAFNYIDIRLQGESTAVGAMELLKKAVFDENDPYGIRAACESFAKLETFVVRVVWPWDRLETEIDARIGQANVHNLKTPTLQWLSGAMDEAWQASNSCWEECVAAEGDAAEKLSELMGWDTEWADPFKGARQAAETVEELMDDATQAQLMLKRKLCGDDWSQWAKTPWYEKKPEGYVLGYGEKPGPSDEQRTFKSASDHPVIPDGYHYDPGIKTEKTVKDKVEAMKRPFIDDELPCQDIVDVSRLRISFDSIHELHAAVAHVRKHFDVVWLDNKFRSPNCLGFREINIGVRQRVPVIEPEPLSPTSPTSVKSTRKFRAPIAVDPSAPHREHISELRLSLVKLEESRLLEGPAWHDKFKEILVEDLSDPTRTAPGLTRYGELSRVVLQALDVTDGRAYSQGKYRYNFVRPVLLLPHEDYVPVHESAESIEAKQMKKDAIAFAETLMAAADRISVDGQLSIAELKSKELEDILGLHTEAGMTFATFLEWALEDSANGFRKYDVNNDGTLSMKELKDMVWVFFHRNHIHLIPKG